MFICAENTVDDTVIITHIINNLSEMIGVKIVADPCQTYYVYKISKGLDIDNIISKKTEIFKGSYDKYTEFLDAEIKKENADNIKKFVSSDNKNEKLIIASNSGQPKNYTIAKYTPGLYDIVDDNVINSHYELWPDLKQFKNWFDFNLEETYRDEKIIKYKCVDLKIKIKNFSGSFVERSVTSLELSTAV